MKLGFKSRMAALLLVVLSFGVALLVFYSGATTGSFTSNLGGPLAVETVSGPEALGIPEHLALQERTTLNSPRVEAVSQPKTSAFAGTALSSVLAQDPVDTESFANILGFFKCPESVEVEGAQIRIFSLDPALWSKPSSLSVALQTQSGAPRQPGEQLVWELRDLPVGPYNITYPGGGTQAVQLLPGLNQVYATFSGDSEVQLLFVDARDGSPVSAKRIYWASCLGEFPGESFARDLPPEQSAHGIGEAFTLRHVRSELVGIRVYADGYAPCIQALAVADGPVQAIELEPIVRFTVILLDEQGEPTTRFAEPLLAGGIRLHLGGEELRPAYWGMNREGLFADFEDVRCGPEEWRLTAPRGFSIVDVQAGFLAPGETLRVVIR